MFCLAAGMRIVARDTIPTFLHVDMKKIQIIFAIPEIGQGTGEFILGNLLVVTAETQVIILRTVFLVKLLGVITRQKAAVLGTMHLMASLAITGLNRAMLKMTAGDIIAHFIMTAETEFCGGILQQSLLIGRVSPVALRTLSLVNRRVLVKRCFDITVHRSIQLFVTAGTEFTAFFM